MDTKKPLIYALISFIIVAFGQPAWSAICSQLTATLGFGLFFLGLCEMKSPRQRFLAATLWFFAVQLVQLSWMVSHPYLYIYFVYVALALWLGIQFGVVGYFIERRRLSHYSAILALSGLWVLMEWSRLFVLSGFSFNPIGLAWSANIYTMQFASLWGIYGLSFWVMLVNLIAAKTALEGFKLKQAAMWVFLAMLPYIYGFFHIYYHEQKMDPKHVFTAILVQPSFPAEEALKITDRKEFLQLILKEWRQILHITRKYVGEKADLLLLPESVLPYGTYSFVYPYSVVKQAFVEEYGYDALKQLPPLDFPLAYPQESSKGSVWMVSNAYWIQALANLFDTDVVVGLEDAEDIHEGLREYYSSALHFVPLILEDNDFKVMRYEKRVLVPMGEYIPFSFVQGLAQAYGLTGSFTHGKEAKVFEGKVKMGLSICYEETYGHMMRENRQKGAEILLNLTSDIWYPNSQLIYQHFDHARLRTVENGIPLLRACNTGITAGLDSLGRIVGQLGESGENIEAISDSIRVAVPLYSYNTLYSYYGDWLIVGISLSAIVICYFQNRRRCS